MSSVTESVRPQVVPEPFDSASSGDCILQSSDGLRYKVYRVILSLASPVFRAMFDLPQSPAPAPPKAEDVPNLPIITVSEASATLSTLLLLLYPAMVAQIPSYDLAVEVIKAYDKYDINLASLRPFLHDALLSDEGLTSNPLGVYAVAWRLNMREEVQKASRYLHSVDLNDEVVKRDIIARSGDINAILALWDLRVRRERALDTIIDAVPFTLVVCGDHQNFGIWYNQGYQRPSNLAILRTKTRETLAASHPTWSDAYQFFGISDIVAQWGPCRYCISAHQKVSQTSMDDLKGLIAAFPQTVTWYEAIQIDAKLSFLQTGIFVKEGFEGVLEMEEHEAGWRYTGYQFLVPIPM
ncbi:hypothetical protein FRB98_001115 [Tulasnella sp. 332]|nr:hypothetical protein FRB98_001115 [Tulasnella sp. 332]